ncbi:MAG: DUF721 domain-containing protein [Treponema sp.]|nr:DUF721 domain-containing protein [Treponema sp.]
MKSVGEILSDLYDERFIQKAQSYSKMYESWKDITEKNGIAAAVDYSRIKDLEKGILYIEMDHPGWKQILQTKQSKLLHDFRVRFPDLEITGLSLILGKNGPKNNCEEITQDEPIAQKETDDTEKKEIETKIINKGFDAIKDEDFKESLKKLGQAIEDSGH